MDSFNAAAIREQPIEIYDADNKANKLCVVKAGPKTQIHHMKAEILEDLGFAVREQRIMFGEHKYKDDDQLGASLFKIAVEKQVTPSLLLKKLSAEEADAEERRHIAIEEIRGGKKLSRLEDVYRRDPEVVLFAVQHINPAELQFAADNVKSDLETMVEALRVSTTCMYYVADSLWQDRAFMRSAVQIDGMLLGAKMVPKEWRDDVEIVMYAAEQNGYALKYATEEMRAKRPVVLAAINQKGTALMYASEELRSDYDVVLDAVRQNRMAIVHAKGGLREDDNIRNAAGQGPSDHQLEKLERIKSKFHELDTNGDGFLSYEELETLLRKGNPDMNEDEIRLLYDQMDTHHDEKVDFHEFCDYIFKDDN